MKNNQKIYKELKKKYSKDELAESFYVPDESTKKKDQQNADEIWEIRKKLIQQMSPEDKIYSGLLRLKYQIKRYIESNLNDPTISISNFLKEYMLILNKKQKDLCLDLDIHKTRLSRILNNRERISLQIAYRLEIHSGELIPAIYWWKLVQKEIEQEINEDKKERRKEKKKVKNIVYKSSGSR